MQLKSSYFLMKERKSDKRESGEGSGGEKSGVCCCGWETKAGERREDGFAKELQQERSGRHPFLLLGFSFQPTASSVVVFF